MHRKLKKLVCAACVTLFFAGCATQESSQKEYPVIAPTMTVDFTDPIREMKPVNGINNGPKSHAEIHDGNIGWGLDKTELYRDLAIPYVRTHDTEYPNGMDRFIDIHCIFPDPSKDSDDESAYHFEYTDQYIKNIVDSGAETVYRLGESIAVTAADAIWQYPPADPVKWADVCAHIVAHYNDGWNNGFKYQIRYWEIWNEPDQARQWIGNMEQYYELYRITAARLKEQFPEIMIGASAPASVTEDNLLAFLNGIQKDNPGTPIDFIDWHIYTDDPSKISSRASMVRSVLDENGYESVLSFLGEWNYVEDWEDLESTWNTISGHRMAAFYAACLMSMQQSSVDAAMYYDGSLTFDYAPWCGLYDEKGSLLPGYYGFQKFSELRKTGMEAKITARTDYSEYGLYACAVSGTEKDMLLISNLNSRTVRFQLNCNSLHQNTTLFRFSPDSVSGWRREKIDLSDTLVIEMEPEALLYLEVKD